MSFNQLPEELVAQMASHVGPEDTVRLLQTEKRVNQIMKRYKMDRPEIEELRLNFEEKMFTWKIYANSEEDVFSLADYDGKEAVDYALSKFRSINMVDIRARGVFNLDDVLASILTNSKTKIKKMCLTLEVDLNAEKFIKFCQNNTWYSLSCEEMRENIFCDEVFCQIFSRHTLSLSLSLSRYDNAAVNFSDNWLETMTAHKTQATFCLCYIRTKFTIKGIRSYIEERLKQDGAFYSHFGSLAAEQRQIAFQWINYAKKNVELDYLIKKDVGIGMEGKHYSVYRKCRPDRRVATFGF